VKAFEQETEASPTGTSARKIVIALQHMYSEKMLRWFDDRGHTAFKGPDMAIYELLKGCAQHNQLVARVYLVNPDGRSPLKPESKHATPFLETEQSFFDIVKYDKGFEPGRPVPIFRHEMIFGNANDGTWKEGVRAIPSYGSETHAEWEERSDRSYKMYKRAVVILWPSADHLEVWNSFQMYYQDIVKYIPPPLPWNDDDEGLED
jgi:hypothetical protein